MISIIDYGFGNLGSIANMLDRLGYDSEIVVDPGQITNTKKIILPGVGAFDNAMNALHEKGWVEYLNGKVLNEGTPILGICLGMQLMTNSSEEGTSKGLGWIKGKTRKFFFPENAKLKVPHMGWNLVVPDSDSVLHKGLLDLEEIRYYFVHSYFVELESKEDGILTCNYGHPFCAAFQNKNVYGVQFHPEKSHKFGLILLNNFASL